MHNPTSHPSGTSSDWSTMGTPLTQWDQGLTVPDALEEFRRGLIDLAHALGYSSINENTITGVFCIATVNRKCSRRVCELMLTAGKFLEALEIYMRDPDNNKPPHFLSESQRQALLASQDTLTSTKATLDDIAKMRVKFCGAFSFDTWGSAGPLMASMAGLKLEYKDGDIGLVTFLKGGSWLFIKIIFFHVKQALGFGEHVGPGIRKDGKNLLKQVHGKGGLSPESLLENKARVDEADQPWTTGGRTQPVTGGGASRTLTIKRTVASNSAPSTHDQACVNVGALSKSQVSKLPAVDQISQQKREDYRQWCQSQTGVSYPSLEELYYALTLKEAASIPFIRNYRQMAEMVSETIQETGELAKKPPSKQPNSIEELRDMYPRIKDALEKNGEEILNCVGAESDEECPRRADIWLSLQHNSCMEPADDKALYLQQLLLHAFGKDETLMRKLQKIEPKYCEALTEFTKIIEKNQGLRFLLRFPAPSLLEESCSDEAKKELSSEGNLVTMEVFHDENDEGGVRLQHDLDVRRHPIYATLLERGIVGEDRTKATASCYRDKVINKWGDLASSFTPPKHIPLSHAASLILNKAGSMRKHAKNSLFLMLEEFKGRRINLAMTKTGSSVNAYKESGKKIDLEDVEAVIRMLAYMKCGALAHYYKPASEPSEEASTAHTFYTIGVYIASEVLHSLITQIPQVGCEGAGEKLQALIIKEETCLKYRLAASHEKNITATIGMGMFMRRVRETLSEFDEMEKQERPSESLSSDGAQNHPTGRKSPNRY